MKHIIIFLSVLALICRAYFQAQASELKDTIDLAGQWEYWIHEAGSNGFSEGSLTLPGSLDSNSIGNVVPPSSNSSKLSRRFSYEGPVSYYKTVFIPEKWSGKPLELKLERTRPSTLIIDDKIIGSISYLSSPHIYKLPEGLKPGRHNLEIVIDNKDSIPVSIRKNSNQASEYTQTNWNGIVGDILLIANSPNIQEEFTEKIQHFQLPRLEVKDGKFFDGDKEIFLRGTVDNGIFPLTGYPLTDRNFWDNYFARLKSFGLNHVRFHSWCPPEAAFEAADEAGFYLQIELPVWGELDRDLNPKIDFLFKELEGIVNTYGHHHSFSLFSIGNELWGDISLIKEFQDKVRKLNPAILTTLSSDLYSGMYGPAEGEDFIVASRLGRADDRHTDLRGSFSFVDYEGGGIINTVLPNSEDSFDIATKDIKIPIITHELGQFQSYPDFSEIDLFTGVLRPDNLIEFKRRAVEAGNSKKIDDYHKASLKWVQKLYKAEIERQLRTKGISGFQLMSIQDYPGQGTAMVGILNSFLQPKEAVDSEAWIQSCAPVVVLAEFPKFTFLSGDSLIIPVKLANYSGREGMISQIHWDTGFNKGTFLIGSPQGVSDIGIIRLYLPYSDIPVKYTLNLEDKESGIKNKYDFWVYPGTPERVKDVFLTDSISQALKWLEEGRKVILSPDSLTISASSLDPLFATDFWNYRMFRTLSDQMGARPSPGTLGLYINENHPAFNKFPTESHTDWQWFEIIKNSRPLIIDRLPYDVEPIIEVIDNLERNYKLALMLECKVGKGSLIILPVDRKKLYDSPEGQWFLRSIEEYVGSKKFKPTLNLTPLQLTNLLTKPSTPRLIKELKNETYDKHWD